MSDHPASSLGVSRDAFLARVRAALGRDESTRDVPAPPDVNEDIVRLANDRDDLAALFAERARAVGMFVHDTSADQLHAALHACLTELDATSVSLSLSDDRWRAAAKATLEDTEITLIDEQDEARFDRLYDVDVGISDVERAIAESGTLVYASGAHRSRGGFLVPPTHIAIVRTNQIVPDMIDHWPKVAEIARTPGELPASMVMITGPSKTADIEGILITGVHGPGAVHILLVHD